MGYKFVMEIGALVKLTVQIDDDCFGNIQMIWEQKKNKTQVTCPVISQGKGSIIGIKVKLREQFENLQVFSAFLSGISSHVGGQAG